MLSTTQMALVEPDATHVQREDAVNEVDKLNKAELRRLMYERIALGNSLATAEDLARRKQQGQ
jgi:cell division protein FtsL